MLEVTRVADFCKKKRPRGGQEGKRRSSVDAKCSLGTETIKRGIPKVSSRCVIHRMIRGDAIGPQP
eukprot:276248-Prorocentrum_minimum.AAC.1